MGDGYVCLRVDLLVLAHWYERVLCGVPAKSNDFMRYQQIRKYCTARASLFISTLAVV